MKLNGTWDKSFIFQCYTDEMFVYKLEHEDSYTTIEISAVDDFLPEEMPEELIDKKKINYFEHSVFVKNGDRMERTGSRMFSKSFFYESSVMVSQIEDPT